jgi:hypothetical protein
LLALDASTLITGCAGARLADEHERLLAGDPPLIGIAPQSDINGACLTVEYRWWVTTPALG